MSLATRRLLVGFASVFCLLVACGGGVDSSWTAGGGATLSAGGVCGPCTTDSECQAGCGAPSSGNSTWCCALNTTPTSCYGWAGVCPTTSTSGSSSSGGTVCVGPTCDAGAANNNAGQRACRGRRCDAGGGG